MHSEVVLYKEEVICFGNWYYTNVNEGTYFALFLDYRYQGYMITCIWIMLNQQWYIPSGNFFEFILYIDINIMLFSQLGISYQLFIITISDFISFVACITCHIWKRKEVIVIFFLIIFVTVIIIFNIPHQWSWHWKVNFIIIGDSRVIEFILLLV